MHEHERTRVAPNEAALRCGNAQRGRFRPIAMQERVCRHEINSKGRSPEIRESRRVLIRHPQRRSKRHGTRLDDAGRGDPRDQATGFGPADAAQVGRPTGTTRSNPARAWSTPLRWRGFLHLWRFVPRDLSRSRAYSPPGSSGNSCCASTCAAHRIKTRRLVPRISASGSAPAGPQDLRPGSRFHGPKPVVRSHGFLGSGLSNDLRCHYPTSAATGRIRHASPPAPACSLVRSHPWSYVLTCPRSCCSAAAPRARPPRAPRSAPPHR